MLTVGYSAFQAFGKEFDKHFGKGGCKLLHMRPRDFDEVVTPLLSRMRQDSKPPGNLKECSPWMSNFRTEFLRAELEIPGEPTAG